MKLFTFGGLSVSGVPYRREKPLLLLTYLTLQGPQARRHLADLFWPDAANPMNSLAQHLIRLRPLTGAVVETDQQVRADIPCDALEFRGHLRAGRLEEATSLVTGAFLHGLHLDLPTELEEWILDTRDTLGAELRAAHLSLSELAHARGETSEALAQADRAYHAPGAAPCPPDDLLRLWAIAGHTDQPLTLALRRDAAELQLLLAPPSPPIPTVRLIGRDAELTALGALRAGQTGWVSGGAGLGKTALLRALATRGWRYLPARPDTPLATLAPLSSRPLQNLSDAVELLRDPRLRCTVDDWDALDDTTRRALTLTTRHAGGAALIIASQSLPAFPPTLHLPLSALSEDALAEHPGAYTATGGHPALLTAFLQGSPTDRGLDTHLAQLGPDLRRLFLTLAVQDVPDLGATRAAIGNDAATLAHALDRLTHEGLTRPDGTVRPIEPARALLTAEAHEAALIHLRLARHLDPERAWPHWLAARHLWEPADAPDCAAAAHQHATGQRARGETLAAVTTLEQAPPAPDVLLLRGWLLLDLGRAPESLRITGALPLSDDVRALRASAHLYCGQPREAQALATPVAPALSAAYAHAQSTLGHAADRLGDLDAAATHYRAAANIWHMLGDAMRFTEAQVHLTTLDCLSRGAPLERFTDLHRAAGTPALQGTVLLNSAHVHHRAGLLDEALTLGKEAESCYRITGDQVGLANALNTQAVIHHLQDRPERARPHYREALDLARQAGHVNLISLIASNLAEIEGRFEDALQIITFLRQVGHHVQAEHLTEQMQNVPDGLHPP
ncbi:tetratricopeptide repeat protein [Deinococcus seoulensis]|uniref:tetratricopeptide repeat protein n=1 Tax=Deinococcus seoulensis TaxID=1837379 RepID=UPI001664A3C2|nr:tetratricopeptide repeat protein [Deinococcus seoulensis]